MPKITTDSPSATSTVKKDLTPRLLNQWTRSKAVLSRGVCYLEETRSRDGPDKLVSVLKSEEEKMGRQIRKRAEQMKREMELGGMKSLRERIKVRVEDVDPKRPSRAESAEKEQIREEPGKESDQQSRYEDYFRSKGVFDFRAYSSDFTNLDPEKEAGKIVRNARGKSLSQSDDPSESERVKFNKKLSFIPPLKELLRKGPKMAWKTQMTKLPKKAVLKKQAEPARAPATLNRKKLKKIISDSMNGESR